MCLLLYMFDLQSVDSVMFKTIELSELTINGIHRNLLTA